MKKKTNAGKAATVAMLKAEIKRRERTYNLAVITTQTVIDVNPDDGRDIEAMNYNALLRRDLETAQRFLSEVL